MTLSNQVPSMVGSKEDENAILSSASNNNESQIFMVELGQGKDTITIQALHGSIMGTLLITGALVFVPVFLITCQMQCKQYEAKFDESVQGIINQFKVNVYLSLEMLELFSTKIKYFIHSLSSQPLTRLERATSQTRASANEET